MMLILLALLYQDCNTLVTSVERGKSLRPSQQLPGASTRVKVEDVKVKEKEIADSW